MALGEQLGPFDLAELGWSLNMVLLISVNLKGQAVRETTAKMATHSMHIKTRSQRERYRRKWSIWIASKVPYSGKLSREISFTNP